MPTIQDVLNILGQIIKEVDRLPSRIKIAANQVTVVTGLSDVSKRLGLVTAGEFRVGNDKEPGFGFSGVRIGYPSFSYSSLNWNVAGVNNDTLQFGLNSDDGKAYAGGGVIALDNNGSSIVVGTSQDSVRAYKFVDSLGGTVLGGLYGWKVTGNVFHALESINDGGNIGQLSINAEGDSTGIIYLRANNDTGANIEISISSGFSTSKVIVNSLDEDVDFEIHGDTDQDLFIADAGLDAIGIGKAASSSYKVDISGGLNISTGNTYDINGSAHTHDYSEISGADAGTDATAAELETLTDGSNADSLHVHSTTGLSDVASGSYTPTLYNTTNIDSSTAYTCYYTRIGNYVTVTGHVNIDPTSTGDTQLGMTIPVASTFTTFRNMSGVMHAYTSNEGGGVYADTTNHRAILRFNSGVTSSHGFTFTFTYVVL